MTADFLTSLESLPLDEWVRQASVPPLAPEADRALATGAAQGDPQALERLVRAHLRDVLDVAIAHRRSGIAMDTLIRRGLDGLVTAARHFDPERHESFEAFARSSIRHAVRQVLFAH